LFLIVFSSCGPEKKKSVEKKQIPVHAQKDPLTLLEEEMEKLQDAAVKEYLIYGKDTFYSFPYRLSLLNLNKKIFFSDGKKLNARADSLFFALENAALIGLEKKFFLYDTLVNLRNAALIGLEKKFFLYDTLVNLRKRCAGTKDLQPFLEMELRLTETFFSMAKAVSKGFFVNDSLVVSPGFSQMDSAWFSRVASPFLPEKEGTFLSTLSLCMPQTKIFQQYFQTYRKFLSEWQTWPDFPGFTPDSVSRDSLYSFLRYRLMLTGELDSALLMKYRDNNKKNDSIMMAKALKKFQKKWNLEPDGKPGKYTLLALGLSKEQVLWQVLMSLDRCRREPDKYPKKYLWINIPSADMFVYEWDKKKKEDTLVFRSRVVVGKPETPTPLLEGQIHEIIIYPYWNVPFKIATEEILPMVQRDTSYLRRKNFEVIGASGIPIPNAGRLPWKKYNKNYFPVRIRQRIGIDNSLGVCKFDFYNPFGVYLHDTNSKRYFKTFYRFQSHGCIRVEKFKELAKFLIREDTLKIPYDTLENWILQPVQRKIRIKPRLPLMVRYYTFRPDSEFKSYEIFVDIYRSDKKRWKYLSKKI